MKWKAENFIHSQKKMQVVSKYIYTGLYAADANFTMSVYLLFPGCKGCLLLLAS